MLFTVIDRKTTKKKKKKKTTLPATLCKIQYHYIYSYNNGGLPACTGGTEGLSHTLSSHSVWAVI